MPNTQIISHKGHTVGFRRVIDGYKAGATFVSVDGRHGFYFQRSIEDSIEDIKWHIDHSAWIFAPGYEAEVA
jgi:hypothetical protein